MQSTRSPSRGRLPGCHKCCNTGVAASDFLHETRGRGRQGQLGSKPNGVGLSADELWSNSLDDHDGRRIEQRVRGFEILAVALCEARQNPVVERAEATGRVADCGNL